MADTASSTHRVGRWATWAIVLAAIAAGGFLRVRAAADQVLEDDEYHAVDAAARRGYWYLHTHHSTSDFCAPLAILNRLLIQTVGLTEVGLRAPALCSGLLLLVAVGVFAAKRLRPIEAVMATALFAASPMLLLYSRFARPYMPVAMLGFLMVVAWHEWRRGRPHGRFWGWLCALSGALAVYFNIFAAPAVVVLWTLALLDARRDPVRRRDATRMVTRGLVVAAVLLVAGVPSLVHVAVSKAGVERPTADVWWNAAGIVLGATRPAVRVWLLASAGLGAAVLLRREVRLGTAILAIILAEFGGLFLVAPVGAQYPMVAARYAIAAVPLLLLLVAVGLAAQVRAAGALLDRWTRVAALTRILAAAACLLAVVLGGPLRTLMRTPNAFANHAELYLPSAPDVDATAAPRIYATLARTAPAGFVVEVPWTLEWAFTRYGYYQLIHGRPVRTVTMLPVFENPGVQLRTVRPPASLVSLRPDVECVIVHRDILAEKFRFELGSSPGGMPSDWIPVRNRYVREAGEALVLLRGQRAWREVHADEWTVVFAPARR